MDRKLKIPQTKNQKKSFKNIDTPYFERNFNNLTFNCALFPAIFSPFTI